MSPILGRRSRAVALALLALALTAACAPKGARRALSPTMSLRNRLAQEYDHQNVFVEMQNGNLLVVAFVNSRFNESGAEGRARAAQEIAEFARTHFVAIGGVERVVVQFDSGKTPLGLIQPRENLDYYIFDPRRISEGDMRAVYEREAAKESRPRAVSSYSRPQDTSAVVVNHLQLSGDARRGLTLVPSFTVCGERVTAPESVNFEFARYSDGKRYDDDTPLVISADGERVFSAKPRLVGGGTNAADGTVSEFVNYTVPYTKFRRLAQARQGTLSLGADEIKLSPEHLDALRDMERCVNAGGCP